MTGEGPGDGRGAARWTERDVAGAEPRIATAVAGARGWCYVDRTDALAQGDGAEAPTILERACVRGQRVRDGLAAERRAATPGGELGASAARTLRRRPTCSAGRCWADGLSTLSTGVRWSRRRCSRSTVMTWRS